MPNGRDHKSYDDYGPHEYPNAPHSTSDCRFGCGCWAGPTMSGGPPGISPFGHCPNNPKDGQKKGNYDYEDCVNGRIAKLENQLFRAQKATEILEKSKKGTKANLAKRMNEAEEKVDRLIRMLSKAHDSISDTAKKICEEISDTLEFV